MVSEAKILFEEFPGKDGNLGVVTLNRPKALNALDHEMIKALDEKLAVWESHPTIKAVLIRAIPGRAFCAGGDVRLIYEKKMANDKNMAQFFMDEYQLNRRIFHYPKPYIALLDGITMGGGAGISIHSSHCLATEQLSFAMPETSLGFFPDIGSSYFLSRLPHSLGIYLGLTGERIGYNDCYAIGLIDQMVSSHSFDLLVQRLIDMPLPDKEAVTKIIKPFAVVASPSGLLLRKAEIDRIFNKDTIEEIITSLERENQEWAKKTLKILLMKSPTSLKVTLQELIRAKQYEFDACMDMELGIMQVFLTSHDFFEGIRAVLIDKDRSPHWEPDSIEKVSMEEVMLYFKAISS